MDAPPQPPLLCERRFRLRYLAVPCAVVAFLLGLNVVLFFQPGPETRVLARALTRGNTSSWKQQISLHPGFFSMCAVRMVLQFLPVPADARTIAGAINSGGVTIYRNNEAGRLTVSPQSLLVADKEMSRQGWLRTVFVKSRDELVMIYTSQKPTLFGNMKCCAAIQKENELVLVEVSGDFGKVVELARKHIGDTRPRSKHLTLRVPQRQPGA